MSVPYVIYTEVESIIKPKKGKSRKTDITNEHEACGFGNLVRYDGTTEKPVVYRREDVDEIFFNHLECEVNNTNKIFSNPKPMTMTDKNKIAYEKTTHCWICKQKIINNNNNPKVTDHCQFTKEYRGAAHKSCNLKLKINPDRTKIPVVFHNLKDYDSYLIMQKIHKAIGNIVCIPNYAEKYVSFRIAQLEFLDSFQFLTSSLEELATDTFDFKITRREFGKTDTALRKGIYPYEYSDSKKNRRNKITIPPKLTDESINQKDYEHSQRVLKEFNCKTVGDYHDLYLKTDVVLLAEVFQTFRKPCLDAYKLDPLHYNTAPGLSWDALLKHTKIDLELLTDIDMHLFKEKGMRGGISLVSLRHTKANNPHSSDYNPNKKNNQIMYYDANNLYGWSMSQPIPYSGVKWCDINKKRQQKIKWKMFRTKKKKKTAKARYLK